MRPVVYNVLRPIRVPRRPLPYRTQLFNRRPQSQIIHKRNGETIRRQDVRFKTPSVLNWRRIVTICMYGASVYLTLKYVPRLAGFDVSVEIDSGAEEESESDVGKEAGKGIELVEEDLEAAEDSFFIPMTWAQEMPKSYYKGTDPEWQEFVKISNDKERQKQIWAELLAIFQMSIKKNPSIMRQLGGSVKHGKHWLDMSFPDGPPKEYMRSGLEFGDGYIAWSRQRITDEKQNRILRALWPTAIFNSAWAMSKALANMQWQQISHSLGLSANDGTSFEEKFQAAAAMMNKASRDKGHSKAQTDPDDSRMESSAGSGKASNASEQASKALWPLPPVHVSSGADTIGDEKNKLKVAIATHIFARTLAKGWTGTKQDPPKGTFIVHGIIECYGKTGRMGFEVQGLYDPKQSKFLTVNAAARHFKRWRQVPKGGN